MGTKTTSKRAAVRRRTRVPESYAQVTVRSFPVDELEEADYNARLITHEALRGLANSLDQLGVLTHPVINVWEGGRRIVGGHQRLKILKEKGQTDVDCIVVQFDPEKERAANFTLNNTAIQGEFVPELVREVLGRLRELAGEGADKMFGGLRLDALIRRVLRQVTATPGVDDVVVVGKVDDDAQVPASKTSANSKRGSVYKLGDHRIACCRLLKVSTLEVFGVDSADFALSRLVSKDRFTPEFLDVHVGHVLSNTVGAVYLATSFENLAQLQGCFEALGGHWSNTLVVYSAGQEGRTGVAYRDVVVPVLYGWREDTPHHFFGDRTQSNLWQLTQAPPRGDLPVELAVRAIVSGTKKGGTVLDVCAHRGATVIAAEKTGRKLMGYAATPRDCDRIRARWTRFVHGPEADWRALTSKM